MVNTLFDLENKSDEELKKIFGSKWNDAYDREWNLDEISRKGRRSGAFLGWDEFDEEHRIIPRKET